MSAWVDRVLAPWDALDHDTRRHWTVILLSGVLFLVHFAWS